MPREDQQISLLAATASPLPGSLLLAGLSYAAAKSYLVTATRRRWSTAVRRSNFELRARRVANIVGAARGRAVDAYQHEVPLGDDDGAAALFAGGLLPDVGGGFGGGRA